MYEKIRIYRKDYQKPTYLIKNTKLIFEINDDFVIIKSNLDFYKNNDKNKLFLNGENLELLDIKLNNQNVKFNLEKDGLLLKNLPNEFNLKITTKIYPHKNTKLSGLYKSNNMFCTQCEAEGFRHITYYLDRPDVLSKWSVQIIANSSKYPTQLSNGNFNNGIWHDPHLKPCYLFALVVGDLALTKDKYDDISLEIYTEKHNQNKTAFAMKSLKNAMAWDLSRFNLGYDLQKYMIVAVDDFNMGAMENKGLNIFNSALVLASQQTATDKNYLDIEAVIGHEYFHNWTGNRITCRDWFQLSLKEGLTVFRDQEFSSDLRNSAIKRIEDVYYLRTSQFMEDNSSLAHPVRPENYLEIDNFYTLTVYEKGAEIVRMIHTILGEKNFQKLMKNYIQIFDGKAVTIDDFIGCSDLKNVNKFMLWYEKSGTPKVTIINNNNNITISQTDARLTPIKYGVLNDNCVEIENGILLLVEKKQIFDFSYLSKNGKLHFSWLRDFSSPVILDDGLNLEQRIFLIINDNNSFVRFDNMQKLMFLAILEDDNSIFKVFDYLMNKENDIAILSKLLKIPSEKDIYATLKIINVAKINTKLSKFIQNIATKYQIFFQQKYLELVCDYEFNTDAIYQRELKNLYLEYLGVTKVFVNAYSQFKNSNCATDKIAAFNILLGSKFRDEVIQSFYNEFKSDDLMLNKWFFIIASNKYTTCKTIKKLLDHTSFSLKNPNKVRSLIGGFINNNINFHSKCGYEILANIIIKLNEVNPQIGARLATNFANYNKFSNKYKKLQLEQIAKINKIKNLSANIFEIINS